MDITNEKELVRFILQYLLENHFTSKSEMARQLDVKRRTIQRAFEQLHNDNAKGSTIVLDRALLFCAERRISIDKLFCDFYDHQNEADKKIVAEISSQEFNKPVFYQLYFPAIEGLTQKGQEVYKYYADILREASATVCPNCLTWCDPWVSADWMSRGCLLSEFAHILLDTVRRVYKEENK